MKPSIKIVLDTRRIKTKSSKYPVKLQVTCKRRTITYSTPFELAKEEFEKIDSFRLSVELQNVKTKIKQLQREAELFAEKNFLKTRFLGYPVKTHVFFRF